MCQHNYKPSGHGHTWPTQFKCTKCGDVCYHINPQSAAEVRRQLGPTGKEKTR